MNKPQVQFISVKNNSEKKTALTQVIHEHFFLKQKVIVYIPNKQAGEYLDKLLWGFPPESFLPHSYTAEMSDDPVIITESQEHWNQGDVLINLHPDPILGEFQQPLKIIELFDETDPAKQAISQKKRDAYANHYT